MAPGKILETYVGGKNASGVYQNIINQIPPHDVFITAFAGNCGVLANKKMAAMANIAIDLDAAVTDLWAMRPGVTAINGDAAGIVPDLVSKYNEIGSKVFLFLDPPYLNEVRSSKYALYKYEMQDHTSHENMLLAMAGLSCNICITHYPSQLYDRILKGWRKLDINGWSRGGKTIERLYMNYDSPQALHDYSFFGDTFRQRELYKKAKNNLISKFKKMSAVERAYYLDALKKQL